MLRILAELSPTQLKFCYNKAAIQLALPLCALLGDLFGTNALNLALPAHLQSTFLYF